MLLTSVIIVLREVLEAALLISILSALSGILEISRHWLFWAFGFGMAGAAYFSFNIATISDLLEGTGQEVSSATMQFMIYLLLLVFVVQAGHHLSGRNTRKWLTAIVMTAVVALAITREGFEVLIYLHGFTHDPQQFMGILTGALIGAGIGISIGALIYYLVSSMRSRYALPIGVFLLTLVAAGMVSQGVLLLIQADWLPAQLPLWDTSNWLAEQSVTGQLLYALVGYESTPTAIQAGSYFAALLLMLITALLSSRGTPAMQPESSA